MLTTFFFAGRGILEEVGKYAVLGGANGNTLETEQEREQEQEQQKEVQARRDQQIEVEKFVDRAYNRTEERPKCKCRMLERGTVQCLYCLMLTFLFVCCFLFLVSCFLFLVFCFLFLVSCFLFLVSCFFSHLPSLSPLFRISPLSFASLSSLIFLSSKHGRLIC